MSVAKLSDQSTAKYYSFGNSGDLADTNNTEEALVSFDTSMKFYPEWQT